MLAKQGLKSGDQWAESQALPGSSAAVISEAGGRGCGSQQEHFYPRLNTSLSAENTAGTLG